MTTALSFGSSPGVPEPSGQRIRTRRAPTLKLRPARAATTGTFRSRAIATAASWSSLADGYERVEYGTHVELLEHLGRAADVVALRVGEHERRELVHAQLVELGGHLGLGRALVDQYCALRDLEEDGVALAHVEHGDP